MYRNIYRNTGLIYRNILQYAFWHIVATLKFIIVSLIEVCLLSSGSFWNFQVYTVGPDYAHAEARKSPALDGKVERDKDGKEIRYPVLLSASEKMTARKVCMAFKVRIMIYMKNILLFIS